MDFTVCVAQQEKPSSAEISSLGMNHGEGKCRRYGGVNGVASGLHHLDPGAGREFMHTGDDRVPGMDGS